MAAAFIFSTTLRLVLSVGVSSPVLEEKSCARMVNFCTLAALAAGAAPSALVAAMAAVMALMAASL